MTDSQKHPNHQRPTEMKWPDAADAIKYIDELLATSDLDEDLTEWQTLKRYLDEDRLSDRKLFPDD
jgi:hypothetical protein